MTPRRALLTAALVLGVTGGLAACGSSPETTRPTAASGAVGSLVVSDGRIAEPPGTGQTVLYFTVANRGSTDDALVGVAVEGTERSDLHRTVSRAGLAWMEPTAEVAIPSGRAVSFAPGGAHVMIQGGAGTLRRGALAEVRLRFRRAGLLQIPVPVVAYGELDRLAGQPARPAGSGTE